MFRPSCVLSVLVLQLLLDQTCSLVLPSRNRREVDWLDQDLSPRLDAASARAGLPEGPVLVVDLRPSHPEAVPDDAELSIQLHTPRKNTPKRRKLAPLDSIGGFLMSRFQSRQDEPDLHREEYRK
ncbi:unnamed protein product [Tetraodon nigroviridis]|uniref:Chromosome undetermined SCAF14608, whole genome shotgun sequence n=1 Tax=Tetraodon nigroviridis TaxID=99883 RepID=Q4SF71_TETNG|nr:unnamed protein product [Tetraodon nigroviridis]